MSRRPPSSEVSAVIEMVRRRYCGDRVHGWFVGSDVRERAWNAVSATEQPPCPLVGGREQERRIGKELLNNTAIL